MKKQVATFFSRAGNTYAHSAGVQAAVARQCALRIPEQACDVAVEIGAGGGVLTRQVLKRVQAGRYIAADIAQGMLAPIASGMGVMPVVADGEAMPLIGGEADLLVSSSTVQWYEAPERSLPENVRLLKKGGQFSISLFVDGTLAELAQASTETGFGSVLRLPEAERFISILDGVDGVKFSYDERDYVWEFATPRDFLRSLKLTGVNYTPAKKVFSRKVYQDFISYYTSRFATENGVRATYRVLSLWGGVE